MEGNCISIIYGNILALSANKWETPRQTATKITGVRADVRTQDWLSQIQRSVCLHLLCFTYLNTKAYGEAITAYKALNNTTTSHYSEHSPLIQIPTKILLSTVPQNFAPSQCLQLLNEEERFRILWQCVHFSVLLQDCTADILILLMVGNYKAQNGISLY